MLLTHSHSSGTISGCIDIGSDLLSDTREGVCLPAVYLNKEQCCWAATDKHYFAMECAAWHKWSTLIGGGEAVEFAAYAIIAVVIAVLAAIMVFVLAPYACGSGIPEVSAS